MSKYGLDIRSSGGKGILRADGIEIGGVSAPSVVIDTEITFDPPSLTTGSFAVSSEIEVEGVEIGDAVELYPPYDTQGIIYQASPSSADNIKISLTSCNSSTVDLASGTWGVVVKRRA